MLLVLMSNSVMFLSSVCLRYIKLGLGRFVAPLGKELLIQLTLCSFYIMSTCKQTWGELIVNANALIMHSFFPVIQGND